MKLLDIMKKYDRCVVRESARLTKIYNQILKESEETDLEEDTCPDCGNDPCTCDESENADDSIEEGCDDVDECGIIPENEFIKDVKENDMLRNRPHNAHVSRPSEVVSEDEETDEAVEPEKMISAKEFFAETDDDDDEDISESEDAEEPTDEAEEMMSAEEFFKDAPKTAANESEDEDIGEAEGFAPDERMISARELLPETDEKRLEESLRSYRRKNHRLFNS